MERDAPPGLREEDYRLVFEALQEGIWIIDEDSVTSFVNVPMAAMLGYEPEEMIGRTLFSFMDERGVKLAEANVARRQEGIAEQHDFEFRRRDGTTLFVAMATAPILDDAGGYRGAVAGVIDLSERREAENALRASEARFRAVFEQASVGIAVVQTDGVIERCNQELARMLGREPGAVEGRTIEQVTHPDDRARSRGLVREVMTGGSSSARMEKRYLRADGGVTHAVVSVAVIRDEQGKPSRLFAALQDVTELKRAEDRLVHAQKLESLGVLAGGIAHDYNNILAAVLANVTMALEDAEPGSDQAELLRAAERASLQAAKLSTQLLVFSGGGAPVTGPVDVATLVRDTARFTLAGSNLRARLSLEEGLWLANADSGQLGQVVSNLIMNAVQAQPDGGELGLTARNVVVAEGDRASVDPGSYVEVTVQDHGDGIPPEALDRIFEPYFTTKRAGHGLGLAVCHRVIQQHGGAISVDSNPGQGSRFTVLVPAVDEPAERQPEAVTSPASLSAKVLVMDDEEPVRRVVCRMLSRLGCRAVEAPDGAAAIERFREARDAGEPFDVAIIDLTIPGGMGGEEAVAHLRRMDGDFKAIVSSGYSDDAIMADHERYGFCAVLAKPYRPKDLAAVLAAVLEDAD